MTRDFLLADIKTEGSGGLEATKVSWTNDPLSYDKASDMFKEMITQFVQQLAPDDPYLNEAEA